MVLYHPNGNVAQDNVTLFTHRLTGLPITRFRRTINISGMVVVVASNRGDFARLLRRQRRRLVGLAARI